MPERSIEEAEMVEKFVRMLDSAPSGKELVDADGKRWVKSPDELWDAGYGIRLNALALWAHCRKDGTSSKPSSKLTKRPSKQAPAEPEPEGLF